MNLSTNQEDKNQLVLSGTFFVESKDVDSTQFWIDFGSWLQGERDKAGVTQEQVAEASGLHLKTISRIERGGLGSGAKKETVRAIIAGINKTSLYHKIDEKAALKRAGFYSEVGGLPDEIAAIGFEWADENDISEIANYMKYRKANKQGVRLEQVFFTGESGKKVEVRTALAEDEAEPARARTLGRFVKDQKQEIRKGQRKAG